MKTVKHKLAQYGINIKDGKLEIKQNAENKAKELGLTLTAYITMLIVNNIK